MGLTLTPESGSQRDLVPEGIHLARCVKVIELGEIKNNTYNNYTPKVMFQWEIYVTDHDGRLMGVTIDGKWEPFLASRRFTPSLKLGSPLRKFLEGWRSRPFTDEELKKFHIGNCAGHYAFLTIKHGKSGKYADVESAQIATKEVPKPSPILPALVLDFDAPNLAVFMSLSQKLQEIIKGSRNCPPVFRDPSLALQPAEAPETEKDVIF